MLLQYLRRQYKLLLFLAASAAIFAAVLSLYAYPAEAVGYAALLCIVLGLIFFAVGYAGFLRRHRELERLREAVHVAFDFSLMTRLLTLFSLHNGSLVLLCTGGTLAVFAVIYALVYRATARAYYKLVRA